MRDGSAVQSLGLASVTCQQMGPEAPRITITCNQSVPGGTTLLAPHLATLIASCHHVPLRVQWQLGGQAVQREWTRSRATSLGLCLDEGLLSGNVHTGPPLPAALSLRRT